MRYMAEIKLVKKVGVGEYQITKKGVKALVA